MNAHSNRALFWAPRALSILIIGFVSLFALDVFGEGLDFWQALAHLAVHLMPSFAMLAALAAAWRREWVGAVMFTIFGAFFAAIVRGSWWVKSIFAVPCFAAAWLFFIDWRKGRERPAG